MSSLSSYRAGYKLVCLQSSTLINQHHAGRTLDPEEGVQETRAFLLRQDLGLAILELVRVHHLSCKVTWINDLIFLLRTD